MPSPLAFNMIKTILGLCCLLLAACGHKNRVTVEANIPTVGTQAITVVFTTADGNRGVTTVPAIDGKFDFTVECNDSTQIELFTANKNLLAAFWGRMGEELKLNANGDSLFIAGREVLRNFLPVSVADTLKFPELELIVGEDSVATFKPEGVWFFTATQQERTPAVIDSMKSYKSARVRDVFIGADHYHWSMIIRQDSLKWTHALMPDAPLRLKDILNFTPCLIEVDTAGTVLRVQRL